ncbi:hypothetical protein HX875_24660, partial [Pseudomonas yamanorum]
MPFRDVVGFGVLVCVLFLILLAGRFLLAGARGRANYGQHGADDLPPPPQLEQPGVSPDKAPDLQFHLREQYGLFWRRKVRLLLVIGEPAEIAAIAPTLADQKWL